MSFDIDLVYPEGVATVARHEEGGTYAVGGICEASLNVTYNYSGHFRFRDLDGKTGAEAMRVLSEAVTRLGMERDPDYWAATPGNAGYAVGILLVWALLHPDARFEVR